MKKTFSEYLLEHEQEMIKSAQCSEASEDDAMTIVLAQLANAFVDWVDTEYTKTEPEEPKEETLQLKVGKTYVNGDGDEILIIAKSPIAGRRYPFIGEDAKCLTLDTYRIGGEVTNIPGNYNNLIKEKV